MELQVVQSLALDQVEVVGLKKYIRDILSNSCVYKHRKKIFFLVHSPEEHVIFHLVGLVLLVALLAVHDLVDELLVFGYHRVLGIRVVVDGRTFLAYIRF